MSIAGEGEPASQNWPRGIEGVLVALSGLSTLDLLGMTKENLDAAEHDSALFETLKITHDLLITLRDEEVLSTFLLLPEDDQRRFVRWIASTDSGELRQARTLTFIEALKASPLAE